MTDETTNERFLTDVFTEALYKLDEVKKRVTVGELFVGMEKSFLERILSGDKYTRFIDLTNSLINNDIVVIDEHIKYSVAVVPRRFGQPRVVVKFDSVSIRMKKYIEYRLTNKHTLDGIRDDILDFAQAAPMTPQMVKQNLFKKELKNMTISDVQEYLDALCVLGMMKRKGVKYYIR